MARKPRAGKATSPRRGLAPTELERIAALIGQKQWDAAFGELKRFEAAFPSDANIQNLLGVVHYNQHRPQEALKAYAKAVRAAPLHPLLAFNKGKIELELGAFEQAGNSLKKALKLKPDFAAAEALLGELYVRIGKEALAEKAYQGALKSDPRQPAALHGLGLLSLKRNDAGRAVECFTALLALLPDAQKEARAAARANQGLALEQSGRKIEAIEALMEAMELAPQQRGYRSALVKSLRHVRDVPSGERTGRTLSRLLDDPSVNPRNIATAVQAYLRRAHHLGELFSVLDLAPEAAQSFSPNNVATMEALFRDPILLAFLASAPVTEADLEILLTAERKAMLLRAADDAAFSPPLAFTAALARQCFANEYVFFTSRAENTALKALTKRLAEKQFAAFEEGDWARLALACCYAPLGAHRTDTPRPAEAPAPINEIWREQVEEPQRELEIAAGLETIGAAHDAVSEDAVSEAVERQYSENPYPRWTRCDLPSPAPLAAFLRAELPHLDSEELPQNDAPRVLIAGCGTGLQTMKVVRAYEGATVLAVDLSRPSLAYGIRKLDEYGVDSVEHRHANILDLGALEERFDLIESYGVIHHMEEPSVALGVLRDMLEPKGLIYLGLYSEIGRQSVVEARRVIAERGYADDPEGIRQARRDILRESDPRLEPLTSPASDFWTLSDTRDLIFHVQEHRFTLLQIGELLRKHGLEFLGLAPRSYADRLAFEQAHAEPDAARDIQNWHAFEVARPDVFGDTYKIWARRAD